MLGIEVSQATVGRYMPWRPKVPSPTWRSFTESPSDVAWRPESGWNSAWRDLREHEGIVSGCEVNWLIDPHPSRRAPLRDS
jgi:hypothetical protein